MADNPLHALEACGQSVWTDYIRRNFIRNGDLQRFVEDDGITGVTSNPTIFQHAIAGSTDYDDSLRHLVQHGADADAAYRSLVAEDIRAAADILRPVYDRTGGADGFVSVEVSPASAHDTKQAVEEAHLWWDLVAKPNVLIKVPATAEGVPAIEELIAAGINVNITLIFAVQRYREVMEAYLRGLERRVDAGEGIEKIASVASFFVSRVDTLVDQLLADKGAGKDLEGKAAIANATIAYQAFEETFGGERWQRLAERGARVQRPLWASTSTKNPAYPDTYYVDHLIGPQTVNTMPLETIRAFRDHGHAECGTLTQDVAGAQQVMTDLAAVGIDMTQVTDQLEQEGVQKFSDSQTSLMDTLRSKIALLGAGIAAEQQFSLGDAADTVTSTLQEMGQNNFVQRLWDKDPALWKPNPAEQNEITDRLGWLHVSDCMEEALGRLSNLATAVREAGYRHAVVLGMGGSSLAPYVFAQSFGRQAGYPELLVLDSTDPVAVQDIERQIDPQRTLFLVSSKSGTTTEPNAFFATFWALASKTHGDSAGEHFVAITDPGTPLEDLARKHNFREVFLNPSDIGGRYSALSFFGLVPAAVMGVDIKKILDGSMRMEHACAACVPPEQNPGAWLGAVMAVVAKAGRDKVTFFLGQGLETLGLWLEQLLAESTGKEGKGLVPVPDNPPGQPSDYANDHLFVSIELQGKGNSLTAPVDALQKAGQPVVRLHMDDEYDLGAEFFRWEFATAVAGALLGINAFDQPNVQESKDNTKRLLQEYQTSHSLPEPTTVTSEQGLELAMDEVAAGLVGNTSGDMAEILAHLLGKVQAPDYLGIMAYLAPTPDHDRPLESLRTALRDTRRVAVTLGYGPRFLHSTGQLHKGGPPEGVFIQLVARSLPDVPIPGEGYDYATLVAAQALGDFQALQAHGRPAVRLTLPDESATSLERAVAVLMEAAAQPVAT